MINNIKHYRNKSGLTQEELGTKIGTTKLTISRYENGRLPKVDVAFKLADALNVDIDDLFFRDEDGLKTFYVRGVATNIDIGVKVKAIDSFFAQLEAERIFENEYSLYDAEIIDVKEVQDGDY